MKNLISFKYNPDLNVVKILNRKALKNAPTQDELRKHYLYYILDEVHHESGSGVKLCSCYSNFYGKRSWGGTHGVSLIFFPLGNEFVNYEFSKNDFQRKPGDDPLRVNRIGDVERIRRINFGYVFEVFLFGKNPFDREDVYVKKQYIERDPYISRLLGYKEGRGYPLY